MLIDAGTGRRVGVVQGRTADVAEKWLRDHPAAEVVCRDGSGAYGEAARQALPGAVQVSDRWHLWHGLGEAALRLPRHGQLLSASCGSLVSSSVVTSTVRFTTLTAPVSALSSPFRWLAHQPR